MKRLKVFIISALPLFAWARVIYAQIGYQPPAYIWELRYSAIILSGLSLLFLAYELINFRKRIGEKQK